MSNAMELKSANFEKTIAKGNWVVDFWAEWCGPCRMMAPILDEAAKKMKDVKFAKLNVDEEQDIAQQYEVMSIPTLIFFKDGEMVNRVVGVQEVEELEETAKSSF